MAVFHNVETFFPIFFLTNGPDDDDIRGHSRQCFCVRCRAMEIADIEDRYRPAVDDTRKVEELRNMMLFVLPTKLLGRQDRLFEITRKMIVYGKAYKEAALKGGDYVLFKCWAKRQPVYQEYVVNASKQVQKEFDKHCQFINDCACVYDKWDVIVHNLTNESLTNINARTFTVGKFREAIDFSWCVSENERLRTGTAPRRKGEQLWTPTDVHNTANYVLGVARRGEADRHQTSRFCQAVERQCLAMVKARRQENDSLVL